MRPTMGRNNSEIADVANDLQLGNFGLCVCVVYILLKFEITRNLCIDL